MSSLLGSLLNVGGLASTAYLPYEAAGEAAQQIYQGTQDFATQAGQLGQQAASGTQFTPFSVRSTAGTGAFDQSGNLNLNLTPEQQAFQQSLMQQAMGAAQAGVDPAQYQALQNQALFQSQQALGTGTPTQAELFQQMQAAQAGENERARLQLENRLAAQGRLGVQTAAFGGTPEQLAMEKAMQERTASNWLSSQQLAPQLAQQNIANATGLFGLGAQAGATPYNLDAARLQNMGTMLGTSFVPEQQMLTSLSPALSLQNVLQGRDVAGANALTQLGMAGLEAQATGTSAMATLESGRVNALADALQGLFTSTAGAESPIDVLISQLLGGSTA